MRKLRERGEPILLFGENELEAFQRLRKLEILEPESNKVINLHRKTVPIVVVNLKFILGNEK
jgi:hypothetical protein